MESKKVFNYLIKVFWVFILGCLFGWVVETILNFLQTSNFQSRQGLIYGPFAQVYGLGAVSFYLVLPKLKSIWAIFFAAAILGGVVEYLCSFFQEYFFGTVSWDYTNLMFNLHGRTSLSYAIIWGILGIWFIKVIYPKLSIMDTILNRISFKYVTAFVALFMIFNIVISSMAGYRHRQRMQNITARNNLDMFLDQYYPDYIIDRVYANKIHK